jgi:hypothetical protein
MSIQNQDNLLEIMCVQETSVDSRISVENQHQSNIKVIA